VLFTVRQFSQVVQGKLLPLVRCPHLSDMWIMFLIDQASASTPSTPANQLQPNLQKLSRLRSGAGFLSPSDVSDLMPAAPGSWLLGKRAHSDVDSVCLTWDVSISSLQEAVRRGVSEKTFQSSSLKSPGQSAPLRGVPFKIEVECKSGKIGIFAVPQLPPGFAICYEYQLQAAGTCRAASATPYTGGMGFGDFFSLGEAPGGWDDAAWQAWASKQQLTASGEVRITLSVSRVFQQQRP